MKSFTSAPTRQRNIHNEAVASSNAGCSGWGGGWGSGDCGGCDCGNCDCGGCDCGDAGEGILIIFAILFIILIVIGVLAMIFFIVFICSVIAKRHLYVLEQTTLTEVYVVRDISDSPSIQV